MSEFKKWELITVTNHPISDNEQLGIVQIKNSIAFDISCIEGTVDREEFTKICKLIAHAPQMLEMLKDIVEQENISQSAHDCITELIQQATTI